MGSPREVWWTGPAGSLLSDANGFALSIQRSTSVGCIQYAVVGKLASDALLPSVLTSGNERTALRAMAAAEDAAARHRVERDHRHRVVRVEAWRPSFAATRRTPSPSPDTISDAAHA